MTSAGASTVVAGFALAISGACLAIFFATDREAWGRANDATIALFAVLMMPAAVEVQTPQAFATLAVAGMLVIAVTSGLTAAGKLDWLLSAKIGGVGFAGYAMWLIAACVQALAAGGLPAALGWFGLLTAGLAAISLGLALRFIKVHGRLFGEDAHPPTELWIAPTLTYLCLVAWTVWLGLVL